MWEFEIIADRKFNTYMQKLILRLGEVMQSTNTVSALLADDEYIYWSIGVVDKYICLMQAKLRIALCDLFCTDLKSDFLAEELNLGRYSTSKRETLNILCTFFDREIERSIVLELLDFDSIKLNITSFYYFKLYSLRKKWLEFCELINQNVALITKPKNYSDLIKFLLGSIDSKCDSVILELDQNCIVYHDLKSGVDVVENIIPNYEQSVLSRLVELNPKVISIKSEEKNVELVKSIKSIFEHRVINY